jgi:hypothetical protein
MVVLALAVLTAVAARAASSSPPTRTVPCGETILQVKFPYGRGYRLVLGVVSVPPEYLRQIVPSGSQAWPHWRKAGLVVRAGSSVSVSVPKAWRKRLAITWGNVPGIYSSLRIVSCPSSENVGYAYAGGFHLRSRSACVPLLFRVGKRSAVVRFGLGQRCAH